MARAYLAGGGCAARRPDSGAGVRPKSGRSGKRRAIATVRSYQGKVTGYLVPEFGDLPIRRIDAARIREMTDRLDQILSPLNPNSKFNGVTQPVLPHVNRSARDCLS